MVRFMKSDIWPQSSDMLCQISDRSEISIIMNDLVDRVMYLVLVLFKSD